MTDTTLPSKLLVGKELTLRFDSLFIKFSTFPLNQRHYVSATPTASLLATWLSTSLTPTLSTAESPKVRHSNPDDDLFAAVHDAAWISATPSCPAAFLRPSTAPPSPSIHELPLARFFSPTSRAPWGGTLGHQTEGASVVMVHLIWTYTALQSHETERPKVHLKSFCEKFYSTICFPVVMVHCHLPKVATGSSAIHDNKIN